MSLQAAAQHLASRGRGPDTTLVHMAPGEVAGLQALARAHGGTLTVNPDTGLPEAGFLSKILPMVIGAGITAATGGAAAPWMIGLGIGGLEAARTGSLSKGLMAGLGAYGGAGLGAGMGLGATEAAAAVTPQASAASELAATQAAQAQNAATAIGVPSNAAAGVGSASFAPQLSANQIAGITSPVAGPASTTAFTAGAEPLSRVATATPLPASAPGTSALENLSAMPTADKFRYGLAALTPAMMQQNQAQYQGSGPNPYEFTYDYKTGQYTRVPTGTRDAMPQTPRMFYAEGGPVGEMSDRNEALTLMSNGGQMYAAGGVSHLGDYSDGGRLLKGPGDGVSDSIPATIADKRPARLADGEFVVPARIVSELGNGSTDAGARKLYAMMDRIQKARGKTTGKDRVAVNSRADKALPA